MEDMFNLNRHIMQIVNKQIEEEDPPVTRITYERLKANGDDEATAKEKIAAVIAEGIYHILKKDSYFDEEAFSERLSQLN